MAEVAALKNALARSPVARQRFVADILNAMARQGVNVEDPKVLHQLGLDHDLKPIAGHDVASSVAVTIIYQRDAGFIFRAEDACSPTARAGLRSAGARTPLG
jgi:hypothetical protein